MGVISTFRQADEYHNYVTGIDGSYRLNGANSIKFQWLTSDTEYPDALFNDFCGINCAPNEQVLRSRKEGSFSDKAYQLKYLHNSEYWTIDAQRQWFGDDFRADLVLLIASTMLTIISMLSAAFTKTKAHFGQQ